MIQWQHVKRLIPLIGVMMLTLTGCGKPYLSALDPKGPVAEMQLSLIKLSLYIMIGVVLVVAIIFTYVLIRYRKRPNQDGIPEQVEGSAKLEILWTVIPIILLIILAVPMVSQTFTLAKDYSGESDTVRVKVIAHQFWWEFEYPDLGIKTAQELYIPTGKKIQFEITSADVIHAFWVPALGGKIDANPGMVNKMWLEADEPGVYQGRCAELCGASHALMDFSVIAVSSGEFEDWVKEMKTPPTETVDADLAKQGEEFFNQSCITCHAVNGTGGNFGPDLSTFGDRQKIAGILEFNEENLERWLKDPQGVKPGNKMPNLNLNDEQISGLVEYLVNLKR
ncbi:cytochrome c oxidase subunit II [Microaerobacter geothermalis]|uniref:cytochrome c oxidase subunit II n=1 Tax=Microaerobacter geothermalis TaxID=674972 RepID=UPI001F3A88ED|nr:cytochrome c oxidase subunit II [Microaerobacter geothermalis]MCF6093637.1 cytochrome c oxidase subunit II [Microaerobacter geothermalis]